MGLESLADAETVTRRRLRVLMAARVLFVSLLLGASVLSQMGEGKTLLITPNDALYIVIGVTYFLTIIYVLLLRRIKHVHRFAYGQIFFDAIFITILVYLTGGVDSLFPLAYVFSIISASFILSKRGTYIIASISAVFYAASLGLEYRGLIHPLTASGLNFYGSGEVLYRIFVYFLAFTVVALLVNHLGEELRAKGKQLRQKQIDYEKLEAFHQNIIQSLDSGLITTDRAGRISFMNRTAYRILGIDPSTQAFPILDTLLPDLKTGVPIESANWEGIRKREEITFEKPDGIAIHLGLSRSQLKDLHGVPVGSILIFKDITQIKEMEEQIKRADRMVSIGKMAAGIAHEIRNPLASLTGSIQVLKEGVDLNGSNLNLMNIILRESDRLNRLVTDFLLFAHPPKTEFRSIVLSHMIDETLEMLRNSPQFNGQISISSVLSHQARVPGDANQLKQVFWNLFLNAVQEMEGGGTL
ncbi:MAG: PAS domain-containing protein, partial [Proteobacteria bacterium]|nr:PAS domain-containing protein [Pseudomonadota bacterium]NIS70814.1 PAS domain-containing protein [Pseudomonadota bacterium]